MKPKFLIAACTLMASSAFAHAGELKIATAQGNVPFEFENKGGQTVGFEVDLIKEVASRLGDTVEVTPMPFNSLFAAVQSGRADLAMGTITITDKRLESVSFAQPYFDGDQCVTVAASSKFNSLKDLSGEAVGTETGSTGEMWVKNNESVYKWTDVRRYEGLPSAMLDLAAGRISADIFDCPMAAYYINGKDQYKIVDQIPTGEKYSMMFAKDSAKVKPVNDVISQLKKDGTLAQIFKHWFGNDPKPDSSVVVQAGIPAAK